MAGGEVVRAERQRALQQEREANLAVAAQAGVGRASGGVLVVEVVHNGLAERLLDVDDVERDVEQVRHAPRVADRSSEQHLFSVVSAAPSSS